MPYARNPFFTGREHILARLDQNLASGNTAALTPTQAMLGQAISGLGGVGKTQTALE